MTAANRSDQPSRSPACHSQAASGSWGPRARQGVGGGTKGVLAKLRGPLLTLERLAALGAGNGGQLGVGRPGNRWGLARLDDCTLHRAHILSPDEPAYFCNEPDEVFSCPGPLGILSGQKALGALCVERERATSRSGGCGRAASAQCTLGGHAQERPFDGRGCSQETGVSTRLRDSPEKTWQKRTSLLCM